MFAFHLDIPQGVSSLDINFDFLLSAPTTGYSAGASATAFLNVLSWNQVVLYPKGYDVANLTFVPSLRLPTGWKFGTALPGAKQNGDTIDFPPVSLETLVDSPVLTGRYFRAIQLTPGQNPPHEMDIAADSPAALAMTAGNGSAFSPARRRSRRALRLAPLSRLPLSCHSERQRGALRPRAP